MNPSCQPPVRCQDFWQYALFAAVAYIPAAAIKSGVAVRQARRDL
jgi:hypothetical protein